ncbi:16S rRNA (adenine(1518)-N(6)/adenine(1519)-N(6))-dimethyltransferase RsmA [Crocinitomicaceae bacterium]|jgi:16S rRNA (adenine1518-N6/adenine1519-N6)-dimethyltransferase|nr:16S rRNA (adenine(1518)-N(6)/adenine(1519)-N(6))-dimethyltransferase RsmA [Crocinitomicaceae bacterium]
MRNSTVRAKKHLGQHFLTDKNICQKIASQFRAHKDCNTVLEIGPGMGALTEFLLQREESEVHVMEIDRDSIAYLKEHYPVLEGKIYDSDFLRTKFETIFGDKPFAVVGNFPYNISSQIMFKCLEYRNQIPEIMGMFQKEVAQRFAEKPGTKQYGVISVLMQAYYDIEYCFTVDEHVFNPPPKVKSGVIRCTRNERDFLPCNEKLFSQVVKSTFGQRRKTIRNSVKSIMKGPGFEHDFLTLRPERLSVEDFIELTLAIENHNKQFLEEE